MRTLRGRLALGLMLPPVLLASLLLSPASATASEPDAVPVAVPLSTGQIPLPESVDDVTPDLVEPPLEPPVDQGESVRIYVIVTTTPAPVTPGPTGLSNCVLKNVDAGSPGAQSDSSSSSSSSSSTLVCGPGTVGPTTVGSNPTTPPSGNPGGDPAPDPDESGDEPSDEPVEPTDPPADPVDPPAGEQEGDESEGDGNLTVASFGEPVFLMGAESLEELAESVSEPIESDGPESELPESDTDDLSPFAFSTMSEEDEDQDDPPPTPFEVSVDGGNVLVSVVDGNLVIGTQSRPVDQISSVTITTTGAHITIDASALSLGVPFVVTGSGGELTIIADGLEWALGATGAGQVSRGGDLQLEYTGITSISVMGTGAVLRSPPAQTGDIVWEIITPGGGTVVGIDFAGFSTLVGAATSNDTFVVRTGGSIGTVDGGAGGLDSLELHPDGGEVYSIPSASDSGTITFEGSTIMYTGLEPILVDGAQDVVVTTTTPDDIVDVSQDGDGNILVVSTLLSMENVTVTSTTLRLLEILAAAPGVTIRVSGNLLLPGVTLRIVAAYIVINGVTIDLRDADGNGNLVLAAGTPDDATARLTVTDAELYAGDIELSATAAANPPATATASVTAVAETLISGQTNIEASGDVVVRSTSSVDVQATAAPMTGGSSDADVAVAAAFVKSTATTQISGLTQITAAGSLLIRGDQLDERRVDRRRERCYRGWCGRDSRG